MKYYSEVLNRLFDNQQDLITSEVALKKEQEDKQKKQEEAAAAKKRDIDMLQYSWDTYQAAASKASNEIKHAYDLSNKFLDKVDNYIEKYKEYPTIDLKNSKTVKDFLDDIFYKPKKTTFTNKTEKKSFEDILLDFLKEV